MWNIVISALESYIRPRIINAKSTLVNIVYLFCIVDNNFIIDKTEWVGKINTFAR